MSALDLFDGTKDQLYEELLEEYRGASPEAVEAAIAFLRVATQKYLQLESFFGRHGLTVGRFSLLLLLRREPTRALSPSELAKRAQVSRATMTQFIDSLEKEELVRRLDDPNDRRAMLVQLTSRAEALLKRILPEHLRRLEHFTRVLNRSERKQLLALMDKLNQGMAKFEEEG